MRSSLRKRQLNYLRIKSDGGFYSTAEGDSSLVMRLKDDYDGAEPSGNSLAVHRICCDSPR